MTPDEIEKILKEAFPTRWRSFGETLGARRKTDRDVVDNHLADFARALRAAAPDGAEEEIERTERRVHAPFQPMDFMGESAPLVANEGDITVHAQVGQVVRRVGGRALARCALPSDSRQRRLLIDDEGKHAVVMMTDGRVYFADFTSRTSRQLVDREKIGFAERVFLARTPDGFAVAGHLSGQVWFWSWALETREPLTLDGHGGEYFGVEGLAVSPDGRYVATTDGGQWRSGGMTDDQTSSPTLRLTELATAREIWRIEWGIHRPIAGLDYMGRTEWMGDPLTFVADGRLLAASNYLLSVPLLAREGTMPNSDQVVAIAGTNRVLLRTPETVLCWDVVAGAPVADLADGLRGGESIDTPRALSISPDGKIAVTVEKGNLREWHARPW